MQTKKKIAFVFGGGGSRGAVQVGMVKSLLEQGIYPDLITGVSIGAINGYYVAQNKLPELEKLWRQIKSSDDVFRKRFLASALMFFGLQWGSPSLYRVGPLAKKLRHSIRKQKESDFIAELRIGAVDLITGEYVSVNQQHPLLEHFLIGCTAIPLAFPQVPIKRRLDPELAGLYVDGCVRNICPLTEAIRHGAEEIHVLLTGPSVLPEREISYRRWQDVVDRTVQIAIHEMFQRDIQDILVRNRLVALEQPNTSGFKHVDLKVYDTHDAVMQPLLDFDPKAIADCIDIGYDLGSHPRSQDEIQKFYGLVNNHPPHGHHYVGWRSEIPQPVLT